MIHYISGDATDPVQDKALICHVANDVGAWGSGFVLALSKKWISPEKAYRDWRNGRIDRVTQVNIDKSFILGNVQFVPVCLLQGKEIWVANMIAQKRCGNPKSTTEIFLQYDQLNIALIKSFKFAEEKKLSLHMPRIGCDRAGGQWSKVKPLIETHSQDTGIDVYVYDLPGVPKTWND
jgi:O-acetyl-ADP-ribose deacetylase (regulator of RNase III)